MARKTFTIDPKTADSIYKLGLMGKTNAEIAEFLGIAQRTLYNHLLKKPDVMQSLKIARARADADVVASLYKRATGFTNARGDYFPPDTTAAIFWLKNRQPEAWRDVHKQEQEITTGGKPIRPIFNFEAGKRNDGEAEDEDQEAGE